MSTRALIGRKNADGTVTFVSTNFDGSLYHTGIMLQMFWNTDAALQSLFDEGKISSLGTVLGEKHDGSKFPPPQGQEEYTVFYHRDRDQSKDENKAETAKDVEDYLTRDDNNNSVEYRYLFDNGQWFVRRKNHSTDTPLRPLQEALNEVSLTLEILKETETGWIIHAEFNEDPQDWQEKQPTFGEIVEFLNSSAEGQWSWVISKPDDPRISVPAAAAVALRLRYNIEDHQDPNTEAGG